MSQLIWIIPARLFVVLRSGALALLIVLVSLMPFPALVKNALAAPMGTITVNTLNDSNTSGDGVCSLREAITRANAGTASTDCPGVTGAPNTITFSVNGTITLAGTLPTITSALTITGNGTANTIIEASATPNTATWRIFTLNSAAVFEISDITLRNGNGVPSGISGGCVSILNGGVSLTLTNTTFSNCIAGGSGGGALAATSGGTITVSNSTFSNNSANGTSGGGAIYINGNTNPASLTITDSTFSSNSVNTASSGQAGGAISCILCSLSITDTEFDGNSATSTDGASGGGAVYVNSNQTANIDTVTFTNNTVSGTTTADGGALYISTQRPVSLTIIDSVFSGNALTGGSTRSGGAISFGNGTLTLTSSRLVSNSANGDGSAIYYTSPLNSSIRQSCITGNGTSAIHDTGAAGTIDATGGGNLANANWWGTNWGPRIPALDGGSAVSNGDAINGNGNTVLGNILVDVNLTDPGTPGTPPTGEWMTSAPTVAGALCDSFPAPALPEVTISPASFDVAENANADFTLTRVGYSAIPLTVSVDISAGSGTVGADYTLSGGSISGQSGSQTVTFPAGQASVVVNFAALEDVDAEADNTLTLTVVDGAEYNLGADTISTATIPANDTVVTNTDDSGDGSLRQAITNANTFAGDDTISFTAAANGTITLLSNLPEINNTLTIAGNGPANTIISGNDARRVLTQASGSLELSDLTIRDGFASGDVGGGLYAGGVLNVSNAHFIDNVAWDAGGAIFVNSSSVTVADSIFHGNQSQVDEGGALFAQATIGTLTNNLFYNNSAATNGGALELSHGTYAVTNNTVANNTAANGAFVAANATINLRNTIIGNNTGGECFRNNGTLNAQNNLIEGGLTCVNGTNTNNLTADPALNGDFTLSSTSPAIDAASAADCPATDQRGESRTADLACDMGAYEMQYADSDTVVRPVSSSTLTMFGPTLAGIRDDGGDSPGSITVVKSFTWRTKPSNTIDAYWNITPSSGTTYNLTLQLCYAPAELNGLTEADLRFWRYSGNTWTQVGPASLTWTPINSNRCASVSGITGFSSWTLGVAETPSAITLTALTAQSDFSGASALWLGDILLILVLIGLIWRRRRWHHSRSV